jgi:hypothetical protein
MIHVLFIILLVIIIGFFSFQVKYSADYAMKGLCEGPASVAGAGSNQFQQYLTRADPEQQKFLKDYYKRIISQLADADSDAEN